jgi:hypothetical protein
MGFAKHFSNVVKRMNHFFTLTYVFEETWIKYMDKHGFIFLTLTYVFEGTWIKYMNKHGLIFLTLTYVFEGTLINTWINMD